MLTTSDNTNQSIMMSIIKKDYSFDKEKECILYIVGTGEGIHTRSGDTISYNKLTGDTKLDTREFIYIDKKTIDENYPLFIGKKVNINHKPEIVVGECIDYFFNEYGFEDTQGNIYNSGKWIRQPIFVIKIDKSKLSEEEIKNFNSSSMEFEILSTQIIQQGEQGLFETLREIKNDNQMFLTLTNEQAVNVNSNNSVIKHAIESMNININKNLLLKDLTNKKDFLNDSKYSNFMDENEKKVEQASEVVDIKELVKQALSEHEESKKTKEDAPKENKKVEQAEENNIESILLEIKTKLSELEVRLAKIEEMEAKEEKNMGEEIHQACKTDIEEKPFIQQSAKISHAIPNILSKIKDFDNKFKSLEKAINSKIETANNTPQHGGSNELSLNDIMSGKF